MDFFDLAEGLRMQGRPSSILSLTSAYSLPLTDAIPRLLLIPLWGSAGGLRGERPMHYSAVGFDLPQIAAP